MAIRTIIDHTTGLKNEFVTEDNKHIYHTTQNVKPVIDAVKNYSELQPGKEFRHVAEIPMVIYQKMLSEGSIKDKKHLKKWLNDKENKIKVSRPGKVNFLSRQRLSPWNHL